MCFRSSAGRGSSAPSGGSCRAHEDFCQVLLVNLGVIQLRVNLVNLLGRVSPDQPEQGNETSSARARSAGGSQGRTRIEPSTLV
jgi:hypothetical protein